MRQLVGGNTEAGSRKDGARRNPAPPARASSHSADLAALGHSLLESDGARTAAPAAMSATSQAMAAFPLDDTESNF
jgi:hypothetical protein